MSSTLRATRTMHTLRTAGVQEQSPDRNFSLVFLKSSPTVMVFRMFVFSLLRGGLPEVVRKSRVTHKGSVINQKGSVCPSSFLYSWSQLPRPLFHDTCLSFSTLALYFVSLLVQHVYGATLPHAGKCFGRHSQTIWEQSDLKSAKTLYHEPSRTVERTGHKRNGKRVNSLLMNHDLYVASSLC